MVVYDTYAWVEYFLGSSKGSKVRELLKKGGCTPSIVLAEISRKYLREGVHPEIVRKRLLFIRSENGGCRHNSRSSSESWRIVP